MKIVIAQDGYDAKVTRPILDHGGGRPAGFMQAPQAWIQQGTRFDIQY